ncbi:MAG: T9SS type A sorting domain-containing protein [Rhodothermales bacterium]
MRRTTLCFSLVALCGITPVLKAQTPETFFVVHCEPTTADRFDDLIRLVDTAASYGVLLTLEFTPQWADAILADPLKLDRVRAWQQQGHEVGAHHHGIYHPSWDGYTDYPIADILARGWPANRFLGTMDAYGAALDALAGDSLALTMGGPGVQDPNPEVDWPSTYPFRTLGGRDPENSFSSPHVETVGDATVCEINYSFIESQQEVTAVKALYESRNDLDVVGVVTHVHNFADDSTFVVDWFNFVQSTRRKTARRIMRDRNCNTATATGRDDEALPEAYVLAQNYPNPFNPTTRITYTLPAAERVTLTIYDTLGRTVRTLVDAHRGAGTHTVDFTGETLPSGLYYYVLQTPGFRDVQTMLLLK